MEMSALEPPDDKTSQKEFMQTLVPYLRLARSQGQEAFFLDRIFLVWFVCWPLKYEGSDANLMAFNHLTIQKVWHILIL
jgi:hypothetical protein